MVLPNFSMAFVDLVNINASFQEARTELGLLLLLILCRKCVYCVRSVLLRTNIFIYPIDENLL
jgi:hypothetical protein